VGLLVQGFVRTLSETGEPNFPYQTNPSFSISASCAFIVASGGAKLSANLKAMVITILILIFHILLPKVSYVSHLPAHGIS
jgi:hypothetical protein